MSWIESAKRRAAEKSVEHVRNGYILGLGSGSTAAIAIQILGSRLKKKELKSVLGIPTSLQSAEEAIRAGIPLTTLDEHPEVDLTIDGADQIDPMLNAIKGGGGALLREKVVASVSKWYILVADETKLSEKLGVGCALPLEVLPFAVKPVLRKVIEMGAKATMRSGKGKLGPVFTDNGNLLIDADFDAIEDLEGLELALKRIPGVIETGLFIGLADVGYVGTRDEVRRFEGKKAL